MLSLGSLKWLFRKRLLGALLKTFPVKPHAYYSFLLYLMKCNVAQIYLAKLLVHAVEEVVEGYEGGCRYIAPGGFSPLPLFPSIHPIML
jgi:hypothetical protein